MNHDESRISGELLDRLVDGESDEGERRNLLRRLDDEPNGWRRLALAFLEAQAWKESFAAESDGPGETVVRESTRCALGDGYATISKSTRRFGWSSGFAVAVGVLLAFGIGLRVGARDQDGVGARLAHDPSNPAPAPRSVEPSESEKGLVDGVADAAAEEAPLIASWYLNVPEDADDAANFEMVQLAASEYGDFVRRQLKERGYRIVESSPLQRVTPTSDVYDVVTEDGRLIQVSGSDWH